MSNLPPDIEYEDPFKLLVELERLEQQSVRHTRKLAADLAKLGLTEEAAAFESTGTWGTNGLTLSHLSLMGVDPNILTVTANATDHQNAGIQSAIADAEHPAGWEGTLIQDPALPMQIPTRREFRS